MDATRGWEPGPLWQLALLVGGASVAITGWVLIMTVFLSFIGLPMFIVGTAMMQSAERR
jgi:hypothetical protein